MKAGTYIDGIRSIEDLRLRSHVDPDTGCWHWKLWCWPNGAAGLSLRIGGAMVKMAGRRAALLLQGKELGAGDMAFATAKCFTASCVNPEHCRIGKMADVMRLHASRGRFSDPAHYARVVRSARSRARISPEQRLEIALSRETADVLASKFGISPRMVSRIRASKSRAPANSVFAWRP